ncbi:DUF397 domain-containing protein [Actinoallomurus purpureus]
MNPEDISRLPWRKSTRSGEATNCIEVVVVESSGDSS